MLPHLLRRAGYGFADYASLERVFDEMRLGYYDAIDASQTKLWTEEADLTPWLTFFLRALSVLSTRPASEGRSRGPGARAAAASARDPRDDPRARDRRSLTPALPPPAPTGTR
jgi:hypothetical protein